MWIKRTEWVKLLTEKTEYQVRTETLEIHKRSLMDQAKVQEALVLGHLQRTKELEARILLLQDELNQAVKKAMRPTPVAIDMESLFDDDPDLLRIQREAIKKDGPDALLAKQALDSSLGEL